MYSGSMTSISLLLSFTQFSARRDFELAGGAASELAPPSLESLALPALDATAGTSVGSA